jgi:hypothetical protein
MSAVPIILNGITVEQMGEILEPLLRKIVHQELTQILNKQKDQFLSPKEACERFVPKISKTTLASWTAQGLLNEHRIGGRIFYLFSEIVENAKKLKKYKAVL